VNIKSTVKTVVDAAIYTAVESTVKPCEWERPIALYHFIRHLADCYFASANLSMFYWRFAGNIFHVRAVNTARRHLAGTTKATRQ